MFSPLCLAITILVSATILADCTAQVGYPASDEQQKIAQYDSTVQDRHTSYFPNGLARIPIFNSDGTVVLSLAGGPHLSSVETGEIVRAFRLEGSDPHQFGTTVAFSPDQQRVIAGTGRFPDSPEIVHLGPGGRSVTYSVHVWDAETGEQLGMIGGFEGDVVRAELSENGKWLLAAWFGEESPAVWDATTFEKLYNFPGRAGLMGFSPDGNSIVGQERTILGTAVWDAATGEVLWSVPLGDNYGDKEFGVRFWRTLLFDSKGDYILGYGTGDTADDNTTAIAVLHDARTGEVIHSFDTSSRGPHDAAFCANDEMFVTASIFGEVRLWSVEAGELIRLIEYDGSLREMEVSPDGTRLAAVWQPRRDDGSGGPLVLSLRNLETGEELLSDVARASYRSLSFSPDSQLLFSAAWGVKGELYDAQTGELIRRY